MDPYPQPNPQQPKQPSRWPLSRKATIFAAVAILVILIGAIVMLVNKNGGSPGQTGNESNAPAIHDRPGYDRKKLSVSTSDPMALKISANSQAMTYKGQPVIQACNVLPFEDLQKEGLLLKPNTLPSPISRVFNDGKGKGSYGEVSTTSISSGFGGNRDVNHCHYVIQAEGSASITINLFQPFAFSPTVVNQELQQEYTPANSIEGIEAFKRKPRSIPSPNGETTSEYILRKGTTAFYLKFSLPSNLSSKEAALLSQAAKNFNAQLARPTGISTVDYDSPVFPKSYVRACDMVTNDHIKQLAGQDATPLAFESIAPSIANHTFTSEQNKKSYREITNECSRSAPSTNASSMQKSVSILVATKSSLEEAPAKLWLEAQRKDNRNNRERMNVDNVGDEAVAYIDANGGGNIIFRKGRITVNTRLDKSAMQTLSIRSLNAIASKLTPIAQDMAERVKQ